MPAYVIVEIEQVTDPEILDRYRTIAAASVAKHGGRYLVRGGKPETLEGNWTPSSMVVLEFPSTERAREWYHSADYAPALEIRHRAGPRKLVIVEGVPD
ncbi:MAG TPA: DUF1330 domain-containing protein [Chthoniobacterales bacterium]